MAKEMCKGQEAKEKLASGRHIWSALCICVYKHVCECVCVGGGMSKMIKLKE